MSTRANISPDASDAAVARAEIERRLPHGGAMCLIERVVSWSADAIVCQAASPGPGHPLATSLIGTHVQATRSARRTSSTLHAVATVEYAAQAVALHASLVDAATVPRAGLLAKLSGVELSPRPVDGALTVQARLVTRSDAACLYAFDVRDAQGACAAGRLMIAFTA